MSERIPEDEASPLGDLLQSMPQETPPDGLQSRCTKAVAEAGRASRRPLWTPARAALASAAACLLLVVCIASVNTLVSPKGVRVASRHSAPTMAAPAAAPASPGMAGGMAQKRLDGGPPAGALGGGMRKEARARAPMAADQTVEATDATDAAGQAAETRSTFATRVPGRASDEYAATESSKPWRDLSGDPQRLSSSELELEARDVPATYDRACGIITKAYGAITLQEIYMDRPGREAAHIVARVPQDRLDGAVAQLKELGRVVRFRGESEDRTREYNARGAEIRDYGQREVDLVKRYQAERNRARKAELYRRIQELRAANRSQKGVLGELAYRTQMAELDVSIRQQTGPGAFLVAVANNAGTAFAWVGATAILWVPLLVLVWVMIRRRADTG